MSHVFLQQHPRITCIKSKTTFKEGANVQTPYGEGKVSAVYADANIVAVTLPSGNAFVSTNNVYPAGSKKSIKPYAVIS